MYYSLQNAYMLHHDCTNTPAVTGRSDHSTSVTVTAPSISRLLGILPRITATLAVLRIGHVVCAANLAVRNVRIVTLNLNLALRTGLLGHAQAPCARCDPSSSLLPMYMYALQVRSPVGKSPLQRPSLLKRCICLVLLPLLNSPACIGLVPPLNFPARQIRSGDGRTAACVGS